MYNYLASDFADFPAKAFQEHLAARLWEEDHAAERRAGLCIAYPLASL